MDNCKYKYWCGIDVSEAELAVCLQGEDHVFQQRTFANRAAGHKQLVRWLEKAGAAGCVCLEATGVYSLDVALVLSKAEGMEVGVLNPKKVSRFAATLCRSKTDTADAQVLSEYARRMPWKQWSAPAAGALELRAITRHWAALTKQHTRQQNRLSTAAAASTTPRCVLRDLKRSLRQSAASIAEMQRAALALIGQDPELERRYQLLRSLPGIGEVSAPQLLGELMLLPEGLKVRQWVAHSGLDPAHHKSGSSVEKRARISRAGNSNLRRVLFMPALVASRRDPHLQGFYRQLLERHKRPMQALMAVARKMLHAIYGMFRRGSEYDGALLFPELVLVPALS